MNLAPASCCCNACSECLCCDCLPSSITVQWPQISTCLQHGCVINNCNGTQSGYINIPAGSETLYLCCGDACPTSVSCVNAIYRTSPIYLGDAELGCCYDTPEGNQCISFPVYLVIYVHGKCDEALAPVPANFQGWNFVISLTHPNQTVTYNSMTNQCEYCTVTPNDLSEDACQGSLGSDFHFITGACNGPSDPFYCLFSCDPTCSSGACLEKPACYGQYVDDYSSNQCDPSGSFSVYSPSGILQGTVTIS